MADMTRRNKWVIFAAIALCAVGLTACVNNTPAPTPAYLADPCTVTSSDAIRTAIGLTTSSGRISKDVVYGKTCEWSKPGEEDAVYVEAVSITTLGSKMFKEELDSADGNIHGMSQEYDTKYALTGLPVDEAYVMQGHGQDYHTPDPNHILWSTLLVRKGKERLAVHVFKYVPDAPMQNADAELEAEQNLIKVIFSGG
jgi:hypothetical protein